MDKIKEVRKSVVRISFKWRVKREVVKDGEEDTELQTIVHSGIIASINDSGCLVITTSVFFKCEEFPENFCVHLPNEDGYGPPITLPSAGLNIGNRLTTFGIWSKDSSFFKPATFDTRILEPCDEVFVFIFPRESYITPTGYARGRIVYANLKLQADIYFQDSQFHEYGHFGAPVFNEHGNLVGICFNSQLRTHVWTVEYIKKNVLNKLNRSICYVGS